MDISYPIHSFTGVSTNYNNSDSSEPIQPLDHPQQKYELFLQGCRNYWNNPQYYRGEKENTPLGQKCDEEEHLRIVQNLEQVSSMVNYTQHGYQKLVPPENITIPLLEYYQNHKELIRSESWRSGDIYVNYWEVSSTLLDINENKTLTQPVIKYTQDVLSKWTGLPNLKLTSIYGIRTYYNNSILAPHVDRNPLILSAIIQVDQNVIEDWPLEIIGRDGYAKNITMKRGEMLLYESHSIVHGRPFPFVGKYYANLFIHFEPDLTNHTECDLPPYIVEGSVVADNWYNKVADNNECEDYNQGEEEEYEDYTRHELINKIHRKDPNVFTPDENGWLILHESSRIGDLEVLELVLEQGINVNTRTNDDEGCTALAIAVDEFGDEHSVVELLKEYGGVEMRFGVNDGNKNNKDL